MKKTKIVLNAMVGNEAATIQRMLDSVVDYVDYYVIQCNGNDDTRDIIDRFFKANNTPGFTYYIDWDYPGWNRDHTLQECIAADHGCDWILRMDADEQLQVDEDFDWSIFDDTSIDSFNIVADPGFSLYYRTWMWNANRPWFFQHDKRHETIHLPEIGEDFHRHNLSAGFRQIITNDGDTWNAPMKFITDGLTLELDKVPSNLVLEDNYHLWYIAKSYNDGYRAMDELPFGKAHSDEYARRVIFYFNMYLNQTHDYENTIQSNVFQHDEMAYYACYLIAQAYEWLGDIDNMLKYLNDANRFSELRNEHLVYLAKYYDSIEDYNSMIKCTNQLTQEGRTNPFPSLVFFIDKNAYQDTGDLCKTLHTKATKYV